MQVKLRLTAVSGIIMARGAQLYQLYLPEIVYLVQAGGVSEELVRDTTADGVLSVSRSMGPMLLTITAPSIIEEITGPVVVPA